MESYVITNTHISAYVQRLRTEERAPGTIEKYLRDVRAFTLFASGRPVTKEIVSGWKEYLVSEGYAPGTINSMLAAVHGFFEFLDWAGCKEKYLKVLRRLFRNADLYLDRPDYDRLV